MLLYRKVISELIAGSIFTVLTLQIFINNEFVNSESGKVFPTINPCTGEKIVDIQEGDKVISCIFDY